MNIIKSLTCGIIVLLSLNHLNAQVGIGNTNPQAALDITSTTDGLLIPRVALTGTNAVLPVLTGTESEIVYNTATVTGANAVTPGFYYLSTATGPWVRIGGATGWLTTGNADIVNGTNFMGTTNNVDVAFRRNNAAAGRLALNSTAFGVGALNSTTAGDNVAFGNNALGNTTGTQNVAVGFNALPVNGLGSGNVAIGYQSLLANTNSLRNVAIGWRSMATINTAGATENVAIGWQAMQDTPASSAVNFSVFVGAQAGRNFRGNNSTGIGRQALGGNNGGNNNSGIDNTAVGHQALSFNTNGEKNTAVGAESLFRVASGQQNTAFGFRSGGTVTTGSGNTFVGFQAGSETAPAGSNNVLIGYQSGNSAGSSNIMIGYQAGFADNGSNKLYIHNANASADASLIYGEFNNNILRTNGQFQIGNPTGTGYAFPTTDGTAGQYLQTNGNGAVSWANQSDAKSVVRTNLSANQSLGTGGWQKINFDTVVFDTNSEFDAATNNRFIAGSAGYYQINAGFHTNNQGNPQFYSIGVYVNGNLYQENTSNHYSLGPVSRNINCIVNLNAGDYVEIFALNFQTGVELDSFSGKTFFEIQQIR